MAIRTRIEGNKTWYMVSCVARSKNDRTLRVRRRSSGLLDELDPEVIRTKLARIEVTLAVEARAELARLEAEGMTWGELVRKYEEHLVKEWEDAREGKSGLKRPVKPTTFNGYIQALVDFTTTLGRTPYMGARKQELRRDTGPIRDWTHKSAGSITPGDVDEILNGMAKLGYSNSRIYNAKVAMSLCFKWGIARKLTAGMTIAPTHGYGISRKDSRRPEVLNAPQIATLIEKAYAENHAWRQVWKGCYHLGTRSGELYQLKRKHVDLVERLVLLEVKWNFAEKQEEDLKDHEWRHVPINNELYELFMELGVDRMKEEDFVFPRINAWKNGDAADVLRKFCGKIGLPSVCFHTLRACWATQLLKNSVPDVQVMAMGGWSDLETMRRYIRLAGIDVRGGTDSLVTKRKERPGRILALVPKISEEAPSADAEKAALREKLREQDELIQALMKARLGGASSSGALG